MEKDQIKLAFSKVKQDMKDLENTVLQMKLELSELKVLVSSIYDSLTELKYEKMAQNNAYSLPTHTPTFQQSNPTFDRYPTDTPTLPQEIGGLKDPNLRFSIGNEGVPTDRQTGQQTDKQTLFKASNIESDIKEASVILGSLDRLKKEIRLKFKQLTSQEMLVFSTIYQLEERDPSDATYNKIALSLGLSESSIRDYVLKMIRKGIPIKKQKINNRTVLLSVSSELKKIATLSTINQLREL
ncbi:Uncharacterised protein [uncultured archaeon]|nr:Uncharacterised protein [uncultured archaeon]